MLNPFTAVGLVVSGVWNFFMMIAAVLITIAMVVVVVTW